MFKEQNRVYIYLIGVLLGILLLIFVATELVLPFIDGRPTALDQDEFFYQQPPENVLAIGQDYYAEFNTNFGTFQVNLYEDKAPNNVNSFVFLAQKGFYNSTKFHRLIPNVILQGGDRNTLNDNPDDDGFGNPGYLIADEVNWDAIGISSERKEELRVAGYSSVNSLRSAQLDKYALAMANTRPNSNSAQFFFVLGDQDSSSINSLRGQFTVIGYVAAGAQVLEVVNGLGNLEGDFRPASDVVIQSVRIYTI